jgi:hypothetical protein
MTVRPIRDRIPSQRTTLEPESNRINLSNEKRFHPQSELNSGFARFERGCGGALQPCKY